ncbi:hypothetical protein [Streptomyces sp. NPDC057509]|uniref:hypothetical protein n=1 Tax=Streptomyces sp. NPDC057509 TaxID=3346152 RepID=UPI0036958F4C
MSVASNLLGTNTSGIDTDASGWTAGSNTTIARSNTRWYAGSGSLSMTASAAGSVSATTAARVAVTAAKEYTAYAYFANVVAAFGRTATVRVDWWAAVSGGTAISSSTATALTLPNSTAWSEPPPILIATAPSGAAYASVTLTVTGLTLGAAVVADVVSFGPPAVIADNLLSYAVQGCEVGVTGWSAYTNCTITASSAQSYEGWYSLLATSTATGLVTVGPTGMIPVTEGTEYVGTAWIRPTADTAEMRMMIKWYNSSGTLLSLVTEILPGTATTWVRGTVTGVAPAGAVSARLQPAPVATATGQTWHVDQVAFRPTPRAAGEVLPYNTSSMEVDASGWVAVSGCTAVRSTTYAYEGIASLAVTPTGSTTDATVETSTHALVIPRQAYQVTPRIRLAASSTTRYITTRYSWYDAADGALEYVDRRWAVEPPASAGWYTFQTSAVAPNGAAGVSISFRVQSPDPGESIYIDAVSLVPGGMAVIADVVPARYGASISLQGLTTGGYTYWGLWRMEGDGSLTAVRGPSGDLSQVLVTGDTAVAEDYEAPLGVQVSYYLKLWTTSAAYQSTTSSAIIIPEPPPTEVVLKDPGLPARQTTAVVSAGGQPQWTRKARQGVNEIRGRARPVVISDVRTSREGTMTLVTETGQDRDNMWWLLETGGTLLIQWPSLFEEPDVYVQIGDVTEAPVVDFAEYQDRTWTLPLIEVDRPIGGSVGSAGRTWQTVNDTNPDWLAVLTNATSWLDVYTGVNGG